MASPAGSKTPPVSTLPAPSSSMFSVGGMRPPRPSTVGAGTTFPVETVVTFALELLIWVMVRLSGSPAARNSLTVPRTRTRLPICAVGAAFVKTKTASEVAPFASGVGSWIQ
jgi:hypothetical protein